MNLHKVVQGQIRTAVRTVLPLLLTAFISFIAIFSQYARLFFFVLEQPWSELLDYQQDYLEKGVKAVPAIPECNQHVGKKILCLVYNYFYPPKEDTFPRHFDEQLDATDNLCNCYSSEIENESVYELSTENFIQQEKEAEIDASPAPSNKKQRRSRRKNRRRGKKGNLSALESPSPKLSKQQRLTKEETVGDFPSCEELTPPPTPPPRKAVPRYYQELENCSVQNTQQKQAYNKSFIPAQCTEQWNGRNQVNKVGYKQVVPKNNLSEDVDHFNTVETVDIWEMEELLAHIEIIRFKSKVDTGAIEWYEKNLNLLTSIDVKALVKKLHGQE
eukprot:TRINITY_DN2993_c0_g1_i1.p2 TRINITY_DN2993_c0_g1~~TRINITY_DN2993_c0_g1_i1.p2  ORF type:complete len:330 (+),score=45.27 TRINITY_DN2993_c0_g1_i1:200-1189(+)